MAPHKFSIGQTVTLSSKRLHDAQPKGTFAIVRLLPAEGAGNQYRIRSTADGHERVVVESELAS